MLPFDRYYPTIGEVKLAKKVFMNSLNHNRNEVNDGDMTAETAVTIALSEVWTAGKRYQDNHKKALQG